MLGKFKRHLRTCFSSLASSRLKILVGESWAPKSRCSPSSVAWKPHKCSNLDFRAYGSTGARKNSVRNYPITFSMFEAPQYLYINRQSRFKIVRCHGVEVSKPRPLTSNCTQVVGLEGPSAEPIAYTLHALAISMSRSGYAVLFMCS